MLPLAAAVSALEADQAVMPDVHYDGVATESQPSSPSSWPGISPKREFTVFLDTSTGSSLGIDVNRHDGNLLMIDAIKPGGLIDLWNEEHPDQKVRVGDRVVEINGCRGDITGMLIEATKNQILP